MNLACFGTKRRCRNGRMCCLMRGKYDASSASSPSSSSSGASSNDRIGPLALVILPTLKYSSGGSWEGTLGGATSLGGGASADLELFNIK